MEPTKNDKKFGANTKTDKNSLSNVETLLNTLRKTGATAILTMTKNAQITVSNWAHDLVNRYNAILKNNPMKLKDIAELPFSKMDVKLAIKLLLLASVKKGSKDNTVVDLRDKFISLGSFQAIDQKDNVKIMKYIRNNKETSTKPDPADIPDLDKYMDLIISEQKVLLEEINNYTDDIRKIIKKA